MGHPPLGDRGDLLPGHLPTYELHWLVSLFFTPGEVPLLLTKPGQTVPGVHAPVPMTPLGLHSGAARHGPLIESDLLLWRASLSRFH